MAVKLQDYRAVSGCQAALLNTQLAQVTVILCWMRNGCLSPYVKSACQVLLHIIRHFISLSWTHVKGKQFGKYAYFNFFPRVRLITPLLLCTIYEAKARSLLA